MSDFTRYVDGTRSSKKTRTYDIWVSMRARCNNPNNRYYAQYGGRGIKYCERWESYDNFFEDMGHCPKGLSLDRTDNDGNYSLENCTWQTKRNQVLNRTITVWLEHDGIRLCQKDWARKIGIKADTLRARLKAGMTMPEIVALGTGKMPNSSP